MQISREERLNTFIDTTGITLIGILSLANSLFWSVFPKYSIKLPFLDFPIFIGEIILFICLILLIVKWRLTRQKPMPWHSIGLLYIIFVLTKVFSGYIKWGPLALRHSALFYYPMFALFGYCFFRKKYFEDKKRIVSLVLVLFGSVFIMSSTSTKLICFIFALVILQVLPKGIFKHILLLIVIIFTPYFKFFEYYRTMVLANVVSIIFICCGLIYIVPIKGKIKIRLLVVAGVFLFLGFFWIVPRSTIQTIFNLKQHISLFKAENQIIADISKNIAMPSIDKIRLYRKSNDFQQNYNSLSLNEKNALAALEKKTRDQHERVGIYSEKYKDVSFVQKITLYHKEIWKYHLGKDSSVSFVNNLFRFMVWKDLLQELFEYKPLLGFDFGKPFRSKSIEILDIAHGEWIRDGWIAAHNSYLETIYRAGIAGVILIGILFMLLFRMIRIAMSLKLVNGILLCGILLNWIVSANFSLTFELPYLAIPFWSCLGMSLRYLKTSSTGHGVDLIKY